MSFFQTFIFLFLSIFVLADSLPPWQIVLAGRTWCLSIRLENVSFLGSNTDWCMAVAQLETDWIPCDMRYSIKSIWRKRIVQLKTVAGDGGCHTGIFLNISSENYCTLHNPVEIYESRTSPEDRHKVIRVDAPTIMLWYVWSIWHMSRYWLSLKIELGFCKFNVLL